MAQLLARAGHETTQTRHEVCSDGGALRVCRHGLTAEGRLARQLAIQIVRSIGDQLDGVFVAGLGAIGPADDPVARQHHAFHLRIGFHVIAQHHAEGVTGTLPWQPADLPAPDFVRRRFAARGSCQRDDRIGVDVIDMRERQQRVQRRVDRRGTTVQVERAVRQEPDHLVVVIRARIVRFESQKLGLIERGKAIELHRADVAARSLDPQDLDLLAGQRVNFLKLGGRVAAAEVGDREI